MRGASLVHRFSLALAAVIVTGSAARSASPTAVAPTVDELVRRHVEALGGRARIAAATTVTSVGILNDHGTLHPMYVDRKRPNRLRVRMFHGGDLMFTEVYDGTSSWEGAPGKELCPPSAEATRATAHAALQFDDALLTADANGATIRIIGRELLGGRSLYHLQSTAVDGTQSDLLLDAETFLLDRIRNRRSLHPGQPTRTIETVFDDYRAARGSGIVVPFLELERDADSGEILTVSRADWIEFGAPLSDSAFAKPAACR